MAIGNFDGVHRGHQAVLAQVMQRAARDGVSSAVLTFEPHPVQYFRPDAPPFRLTTLEQKARLIEELSVDGVVAVRFDASIAKLSPEEFVQGILHKALNASTVFVGADFRFGRNRAGDVETLRTLGGERGIGVVVVDPVREEDGTVISSTRIRTAVREGRLEDANTLLGRPYTLVGRVVHGAGKGTGFGFPTANLRSANPLLPPDGIYASRLHHAGVGALDAATYIGTRPTIGDELERAIEAYCLSAPDEFEIYGDEVELELIARVRDDRRFDSVDELIAQIGRDVEHVREILGADV